MLPTASHWGWRRAYSSRAVARLGCAIIAPSVNRFRLHLLVLVERRCPARPREVATAASLLVGVVEGTRLQPMRRHRACMFNGAFRHA